MLQVNRIAANRKSALTDVFSREKRSWVMSRIRGKDTSPERMVRSFLHRHGFRFRLHVNRLPGRPDIVLPKLKTVIFVHGCFWHHHTRCKYAVYPRTRAGFWRAKIDGNVIRDRNTARLLRKSGWAAITIWECEIERKRDCWPHLLKKLDSLTAAGIRSGAKPSR